jgi:hypothetical protein
MSAAMDVSVDGRSHADRDAGAFLSKKLSGRSHLVEALGHNLREFAVEHGAYGNRR